MADGDEPFQILNIQFSDIEFIEPAGFDPNVKSYHLKRGKSSLCSVAFSVTGNISSDEIYRKYQFCCDFSSNSYRAENWMPNQPDEPRWRSLSLPNTKQTLTISFGPQKAYKEKIPWVVYKFEVDPIELAPEEVASCTHPSTYECEGEVWGGASGSCQVEILRTCRVCMKVVDRYFDYRN